MNDLTSEIEYLYRLKRDIENRIDELAPRPAPPPAPATPLPRLAVIVGHSRKAPGAWGKPPVGMNEYFWNTDLAAMMAKAAQGVEMQTFFRDDGGVRGAYGSALAWDAGAIMELHFNAAASISATGTETIHIDRPGTAKLAQAVQKAMVGALGLRDRGVKLPWEGRGQSNLEAAGVVPAVIIEPFFGSNTADCTRAAERMGELAKALVGAGAAFLKEKTNG